MYWSETLELSLLQVDLLRGEAARSGLLELTDSLRRLAPFEEVFPVSAARGHGVSELAEHLLSR
jgi:GTPase Era involved in 16S rRNA processing